MTEVGQEKRIVFDPFSLDLANECLWKGSQAIKLRPKAFAVLRYLAERPGRLVPKEELLDVIWPSVHVSPEVLKVTIAEIRKILDDCPKTPRYIETAHRRGYRFIAKTETNTEPAQVFCVSRPETPRTRYTRSRDVTLAYQVLGEGPIDLVFVMGWVSHLDYFWTEPSFARFLRRLASNNSNPAAIVEQRHDIKADVLMWIRNHSHHHFDPGLIAEVHNLFDIRHAFEIHGREIAQVRQHPEAWLEFSD